MIRCVVRNEWEGERERCKGLWAWAEDEIARMVGFGNGVKLLRCGFVV